MGVDGREILRVRKRVFEEAGEEGVGDGERRSARRREAAEGVEGVDEVEEERPSSSNEHARKKKKRHPIPVSLNQTAQL